jgi:hypothetical protein
MKLTARRASPNSLKPLCGLRSRAAASRAIVACALLFIAACSVACQYATFRSQSGMPPEAQTLIDTFTKDMAEERHEKIYAEAAEEWRRTATLEQTKESFTTLKEKLGGFKSRDVQTIRDQDNSGGPLPGHSLVVIYQSAFERAEAMETFTLVERDGRWLLARYFVNSSALK